MKILISSCLLGEDVRYDGGNSSIIDGSSSFFNKELFLDILEKNEIFSFCPEVAGGLSTPRDPAEIINHKKPFLIQTQNKEDVTIPFLLGAKKALEFCQKEGIKIALLKAKSPSCGNKKVYDGTFSGNLIDAQGFCARLLSENGVKVFNETELKELNDLIH